MAREASASEVPAPNRTEELLLAALINHNKLLTEFVEDLAGLDFADRDLDGLRQALIDCIAGNTDLDSEGVKCHLSELGFSGLLATLLAPERYVHGRFARPDASEEVARQSVMHILGVMRERRLGPLVVEEANALAKDMAEEQLKRMQAAQKIRDQEEGRKVDLDRFEALSERSVHKADS